MADQAAALLTVAEAWQRLEAQVPALRPALETVPVTSAVGRVLAVAPQAALEVPAADKSAMDGFAVKADDVTAGKRLRISQRIAAGSLPQALARGTTARIFTGAMLPAGADSVVIQENCDYDDEFVSLKSGIAAYANVRRKGEDIAASALLLSQSHRVRCQDIGLLITAGVREVTVYCPLKVAVIATGDELLDISEPPQPQKIYESNSPMIACMLVAMGCQVTRYRVADTLAATIDVLNDAAGSNHAVITIGGVSVGDEDHVQGALRALGKVDFWKILIKPGKPFLCGDIRGVPVLGLPGNPVSSFVTFGMFCRPFLAHLAGVAFAPPVTWTASADFSIDTPGDREEYLRGKIERVEGKLVVRPLGAQGSGMQNALSAAEVLIAVPAGVCVTPGQPVNVIPLTTFVP